MRACFYTANVYFNCVASLTTEDGDVNYYFVYPVKAVGVG